jgi:hypothetical protein
MSTDLIALAMGPLIAKKQACYSCLCQHAATCNVRSPKPPNGLR